MRFMLLIAVTVLLVVATVNSCNWLTLEPDVDKPLECDTTEPGEAWSQADSAWVPSTRVYICRETPVGWAMTWCWFSESVDMPLKHLQLTCETLHGWHRQSLPTTENEDTTTGVR